MGFYPTVNAISRTPLASCQNRDLPTARWEHRIGARRELDHNDFLRDFYRISCECGLELFGDLAELPVSQHRRGSGQAQREYLLRQLRLETYGSYFVFLLNFNKRLSSFVDMEPGCPS